MSTIHVKRGTDERISYTYRGVWTNLSIDKISPAFFPGQKLPTDPKPEALNAICGVYPVKNGKKVKAVECEPNQTLRDYENIPLEEDIVSFFLREVQPFVPDAWIKRDAVDG